MKTHQLNRRDLYPQVHYWVTTPNKVNVYSKTEIHQGDKVVINSKTRTVEKLKIEKPTNSDHKKTMFYAIDLLP